MRSVVFALMVVLFAVAAYFAASYWQNQRAVPVLNAGDPCDLGKGGCTHALPDGGQLTVELSPRPVPLMETVRVNVVVSGSKMQPSHIDITGLNMEMGVNRVALTPTAEARWQGETIIPICSQRQMHWRSALLVQSADEMHRIDDEFYTLRP